MRKAFLIQLLMLSCAINILLDLFFVCVLDLSVFGAALATILSQLFSAVIVMYFLFSTREAYRVTPRTLCMHMNSLKRILEIGIPTALQSSMYSVSNFIIQIALNTLGTVVVASWSMAGKIDGVYWAVSSALGTAIMSFVGQNYGAGKKDRIRGCAGLGMLISLGITVFLVALILFFGQYGVHLLIDDAAVVDCTWQMLRFFVPYYFLWTIIEVLTGVLRGMGDALIPVITYAGPEIAYIITGSMVIETVFTVGGIGSKFVSAITNRDYTMIMATTIFLATLMVVANLLCDILYKVVDPRIKYD